MFPDAPAFRLADAFAQVDVADWDSTLALSREYGVSGVLADTSDVGVPTAAYVSSQLRLPGLSLDAALNACNKVRMRESCAAAGLSSPGFWRIDDFVDPPSEATATLQRGKQVVVKPADSHSGRGVSVVSEPALLPLAIEKARQASRSCAVLIEEFISGTEVIVDGFVSTKGPVSLAIASKVPDPRNPSIATHITYPALLPPESMSRICEANARAIGALGLTNGLFHAEYMVTNTDVYPIDIAARGGGVHIYRVAAPHVSGVDLSAAAILAAIGEPIAYEPPTQPRGATIAFLNAPPGRLTGVRGVEKVRSMDGIAVVHLGVSTGDRIRPPEDKNARPGHVVALAENNLAAMALADAAVAAIELEVEPMDN